MLSCTLRNAVARSSWTTARSVARTVSVRAFGGVADNKDFKDHTTRGKYGCSSLPLICIVVAACAPLPLPLGVCAAPRSSRPSEMRRRTSGGQSGPRRASFRGAPHSYNITVTASNDNHIHVSSPPFTHRPYVCQRVA
jgi:hypothetical protein